MLFDINTNDQDFDNITFHAEDIDNLKKLINKKWIEIASGDIVTHIQDEEFILDALGKKPGTYYRDIIFALTQIRLPEDEAKRDWKEILKHKYTMSEKLGRNVGIHVATLDYYINIKKRMRTPKIVEADEYADTASRAMLDELTKAYNRFFFEEEFKQLFAAAQQGGPTFGLLMIDLDYFKMYNDLNGHIQGDIALTQTVQILHAVCKPEDTVARYGGEEFAILLEGQDLAAATVTAENIRCAVYDYRFVNEQRLPGGRLSASLGVSAYRSGVSSPLAILEEADAALYRAKKNGRNQVQAFGPGIAVEHAT